MTSKNCARHCGEIGYSYLLRNSGSPRSGGKSSAGGRILIVPLPKRRQESNNKGNSGGVESTCDLKHDELKKRCQSRDAMTLKFSHGSTETYSHPPAQNDRFHDLHLSNSTLYRNKRKTAMLTLNISQIKFGNCCNDVSRSNLIEKSNSLCPFTKLVPAHFSSQEFPLRLPKRFGPVAKRHAPSGNGL